MKVKLKISDIVKAENLSKEKDTCFFYHKEILRQDITVFFKEELKRKSELLKKALIKS